MSDQSIWIRTKSPVIGSNPSDPVNQWSDNNLFARAGGSSGGGLSQSGVDLRINQLVFDWAEEGNTDLIPITKIPEDIARTNQIELWALDDDTPIPANKLENAPVPGLDETAVDGRVQLGVEDWAETRFPNRQIPRNKLNLAPRGGIFAEWSRDYHIDDRILVMNEMRILDSPSVALIEEMIDGENTLGISISKGFSEFAFIPIQAIIPRVIEWGSANPSGGNYADAPTDETLFDATATVDALKVYADTIPFVHARRIRAGTDEMGFPIDFCIYATRTTGSGTDPDSIRDIVIKFAGVNYPGFFDNIVVRLLQRVPQDSVSGGEMGQGGGGSGTGGLTQSEVDNRIALWARWANNDGTTIDIPEEAIPDSIARTSQLTSAGLDQDAVDARTVTSGSVSGTTLTLVKTGGDDVTITGLPAGLDQGAVDERIQLGVSDWAETGNTSQIPSGRIPVDDWVKTGNSSRVPDAKIPPEIARVSEIVPAIETAVPAWARDATTPVPTDKLPEVTTFTEDDARAVVLEWARTGNTGQIPNEKLDSREANAITAGVLLKLGSGARRFIDQGDAVFAQSWTGRLNITNYDALENAHPGVTPVAIDISNSVPPEGDELEYESAGGLRGIIITLRGNANDGTVANFQWMIASTGEYFRQLTPGAQFQRVGKGVAYAWAERGNLDKIPVSKLPTLGATHSELDITYDFGQSLFSNVHELVGEPDPTATGRTHIGNAIQDMRFRTVGGVEILAGEGYIEFRARVVQEDGTTYTDPLPRRFTLTGLEKDRRYLAEELESHHGTTEVDIDFAIQLRDNVNGAGETIPGVRITLTATQTNQDSPPVFGILLLEYARPVSNVDVDERIAQGVSVWAHTDDIRAIPPEKLVTAHKAIPIPGNPTAADLNDIGPGIFLFTNVLPVLGIPIGTWLLVSNQNEDGSVDLYQEAKRLGGGDPVTYFRRKISGTWQTPDLFVQEQTGSSESGLSQNDVDGRIAIWARVENEAGTTDIPEDAIPDTIARTSQVENAPRVPDGGTTGQLLSKTSDADGDADWIDAPSGSSPIVLTDNYVHIGTPDLSSTTITGVVSGADSIKPAANRSLQRFNVRFDNTLSGFNIPTGGNYDPSDGDIQLPEGHWIICASLNIVVTGASNSRTQADLSINHGENQRHSQAVYLRGDNDYFGATGINDSQGKVSVTGAVVSDGTTPIRIRVAVSRQSDPANILIRGAHVHGYRQLVGGSSGESSEGDGNAFIISPIQADTTSINGAEAGAYSFTVPADTTRLGLPSGHYFMRAYEWDVSGNDAIQEAIGIDSGIHYTRTNSTGEWSTSDLFTQDTPQWSANLLDGTTGRTAITSSDFSNTRTLPEMEGAQVVKVVAGQSFDSNFVNLTSDDIIDKESTAFSHRIDNGRININFSFPNATQIRADGLVGGEIIGVYIYR